MEDLQRRGAEALSNLSSSCATRLPEAGTAHHGSSCRISGHISTRMSPTDHCPFDLSTPLLLEEDGCGCRDSH